MTGAKTVDDTILRYADSRSPEEISKMLGGIISPERVAAHTKTLLRSKDWLEQAEQEALAFHRLKNTIAKLESEYVDLDRLKVQFQFIRVLFDRFDKRSAANEVNLETYNRNVGRVLGRVVDSALSYMRGALRDEVDPEQWDILVAEALRHAQVEIARHEVEA